MVATNDCRKRGTETLVGRAYPESFRAQVLAAYQERCSMRGVCRIFGISRNTLIAWLKKVSDLPQLRSDRLLFAGVAVSAGICEEVLFRGCGLRFFAHLGLSGYALLLAAAAFGLVYFYQGAVGVIATFVVGLLLSVAYVATGSLIVPIILHTLIDFRPLLLPTPHPTAQV